MRLVTRCPACRALFEVRERQLQACEGWLRCGQCFHAFDSTGLVLPWSPEQAPETAPAGPEADLSAPRIDIRSLLRENDSPAALLHLPVDPLFQRLVPSSLDLDGPSLPTPSSIAVTAHSPAALTSQPPSSEDLGLQASVQSAAHADARSGQALVTGRAALGWALACLVALMLLVGQGVQTQLGGLQLAVPALQGWGQRLCAQLGCDWPAVRAPLAVQLDSARLLREEEGRLVLTLRVRNTAAVDVAFGALELSLLGPDAEVLVRRVLGPPAIGAPAVLSADAVWEGRLQLLMDPQAQVQGYRALIFQP